MQSPRDFLHITSAGALLLDVRSGRALFTIRKHDGDITYEFPQAVFSPPDIVSPYYATAKRALFDFCGINLSCFTIEETSSLVIMPEGDDGHGLAIVKLIRDDFYECITNHIPVADAAIRKHAENNPMETLLGLEWIGLDDLYRYLNGDRTSLPHGVPNRQSKQLLMALESGVLLNKSTIDPFSSS